MDSKGLVVQEVKSVTDVIFLYLTKSLNDQKFSANAMSTFNIILYWNSSND